MKTRITIFLYVLTFTVLCAGLTALYAEPAGVLKKEFKSPPPSAKPYTWWHWMSGNITKEGITADLEYLNRIGVGGVQLFNIQHSIPKGPVDFYSDEWFELFDHAASEAKRLGLVFGMHNSPGWATTGGPWIRPEHASKRLTWSINQVKGASRFKTHTGHAATTKNGTFGL